MKHICQHNIPASGKALILKSEPDQKIIAGDTYGECRQQRERLPHYSFEYRNETRLHPHVYQMARRKGNPLFGVWVTVKSEETRKKKIHYETYGIAYDC